MSFSNKIKSVLKKKYFRWYWEKKDNNAIEANVQMDRNTFLEGGNRIASGVDIQASQIGYGSYIAGNTNMRKVTIGRYYSLADNIDIIAGHHPVSQYISTHPCFYSAGNGSTIPFVTEGGKEYFEPYKYVDHENKYFVSIGNDVWIGRNAQIMEGVTVGDGAIIGAGALVVKDVEPYSVYGGVPARKIKMRFTDQQIEMLLKFKWWENDSKWLLEHAEKFRSPDEFFQMCEVISSMKAENTQQPYVRK